ncbi:MAG: hypothetical protein ABIP45_14405 [Knoellia sp.]
MEPLPPGDGVAVPKLNDCHIAAVSIRTDALLVHRDVDFDVIASASDLETRSLIEAEDFHEDPPTG